jgi:ABC-type transport system involved in multi-copper enzyme maturation permease subunit
MLKIWPMLKSLLWKEFRELLPLSVAALAAQAFLLLGLMRFRAMVSAAASPRDAESIWPIMCTIAVLFAVAAGLWQCARENQANHYQFLLHRPLHRNTIFISKLALGAAVCLLTVGLPLLCFAFWVDNRLAFHSMAPWLSEPAWKTDAGLLLLYLGGFLSALRPGRWYGSRFLPLFAGILLFIIVVVVAQSTSSWMWFPMLIAGPIFELCFAAAILHVARTRSFS